MKKQPKMSVIIPLYNEESWIEKCLKRLIIAIDNSKFLAEIIVVNDGSTDESLRDAQKVGDPRIKIISQKNKGRYIARKEGLKAAEHDNILFIDPKVMIHKNALRFLCSKITGGPNQRIWNAHVDVHTKNNIFAKFWDTLTRLGWRAYFSHPREVSYQIQDFNRYPKGTGLFFCPKSVLKKSMEEFERQNGNGKFVSDDTALLRIINQQHAINISPEFSCTYYGRDSFSQFISHAYRRGQNFIAGYFYRQNVFFLPLMLLFIACIAVLVSLSIFTAPTLIAIAAGAAIALVGSFIVVVCLRVTKICEALWFTALLPVFIIVFGAGLWRGLTRKLIG
jgi:glycosyltransferase involved in cell wall biosynthesis